MPKVSVILPVFNTREYLEECLQSALGQDFTDFELICIDGGSTDGSAEILARYAKKDARMRVIGQQAPGLSAARNAGIAAARGTYICFLDSDDKLEAGMLERIVPILDAECLDLLSFRANLLFSPGFDEKSRLGVECYFAQKAEYHGMLRGKTMLARMVGNEDFCCPVWLLAVRRSFLESHGICFEEGICAEDNLYSVVCYLKASRVRHIDEKLYCYRKRMDSLLHGENNFSTCFYLYSCVRVWDAYMRLLEEYEEDEEAKKALVSLIDERITTIRGSNKSIPREAKEAYTPPDVKTDLLFRAMALGKYHEADMEIDTDIYLDGFIRNVERASTVVLYGAGYVGNLCLSYCRLMGRDDKIAAFVVTKADRDSIGGKPVYSIAELGKFVDTSRMLLVLSVDKKTIAAIEENCRRHHFHRLLRLDGRMIASMRRKVYGGEGAHETGLVNHCPCL